MDITIKEVKSKQDLREFISLPFKIYKNHKNWVPPIKKQEEKVLNRESNPAFEYSDTRFWIVLNDGKCVGRIGVVINKDYNKKMNIQAARFTRFETIEDEGVANLLLKTAEDWAKEKGMKTLHGPLGFNNLDLQGLLIEGFDYLQSIASVYHPAYYQGFIEKNGYKKEIDWVEFRLTLGDKAVQKAKRGAELIKRRYGLEVLHFNKIKELLPYSDTIFDILNDAFSDLPFVSPFNEKLKKYYKHKYIGFLNPEFVKMVKLKEGNKIIGFIIGIPSLSEAMQKANGKLFPFGWRHILNARKTKGVDTMDQALTGVLKEYQHTGAGVVLMAEIQDKMQKHGLKYIETTGIFETNTNAISNWKNYENIQHKRRRAYVKELG